MAANVKTKNYLFKKDYYEKSFTFLVVYSSSYFFFNVTNYKIFLNLQKVIG